MKKYLIALAAAVLAAAPISAQVTVTTGPIIDDGVTPLGLDSFAAVFGPVHTAMAETFTLPGTTNYLQTFSFFITSGFSGGTDLQLAASVYEFGGDRLVGPALFFSGLFPGTDDDVAFHELKFGPVLNLHLTPGVTYALVLSAVEGIAAPINPTPDGSTVTGGAVLTDRYAGGSLFVTDVTDPADLFKPNAFLAGDSPDAAFRATFTAGVVPEPSSVALIATGFIGVTGMARRRRTKISQREVVGQ